MPFPRTAASTQKTPKRKGCKNCQLLREMIEQARASGEMTSEEISELWATVSNPEPARTEPDPATLLGRTNGASNPDTPTELLEQLAQDPLARVRRLTASNPATPPTALQRLVNDPDTNVAAAAQAALNTQP